MTAASYPRAAIRICRTVAGGFEATALATLDSKPDAANCRTVFQQLDAADGASSRPTLSESERATIAALWGLTPTEVGVIGLEASSRSLMRAYPRKNACSSGRECDRAEDRRPLATRTRPNLALRGCVDKFILTIESPGRPLCGTRSKAVRELQLSTRVCRVGRLAATLELDGCPRGTAEPEDNE